MLAVLAGLGFAVGLQCTDGMATGMASAMPMPMSIAHGANSANSTAGAFDSPTTMAASPADRRMAPADTDLLTATSSAPVAAFAVAPDDSPSSSGLGGVLATCLAFILAVVAAVATLRPGRLRSVARLLRPARATVIRALRPRAPSLAELCVLRT